MANQARLWHLGASNEYASLYTGIPTNPGALDDAVTGDTIEVLEDISFASTGTAGQRSSIYLYDKGITLDLGGHTLSFTAAQDTVKATAIEIKSTSGTLNTEIKNGTIHTENGCTGIYVDANSDVKLTDLNVEQNGTGAQAFDRYAAVILSGATAEVSINGGIYTAENIVVAGEAGSTVDIDGGTFIANGINTSPLDTADASMGQGYKAIAVDTGATLTIDGGTFGSADNIAVASKSANTTINAGTFNGRVLSTTNKVLINDGTFNESILFDTVAAVNNFYQLEGGSFVDDVSTVKNGDGSAMVINPRLIVDKVGNKYLVIVNPHQVDDAYKYMNGDDLAVLWKLIKQKYYMNSGKATNVEPSGAYGNVVDVLIDSETIKLRKDNKLFIDIDKKTIVVDSEGKLAATFQKSTAIKPIQVSDDGEISLLYGKALTLDSEERLIVPIDELTIIIDSEGKLKAVPEPLKDGIATQAVYDGRDEVIDVLYDDETIKVNSENELFLPIDNITIKINSEGLLAAAGVEEGIATKLRAIPGQAGVNAIDVLYDDETIKLDSENTLFLPIDRITIRISSEGKLVAAGVREGKATELEEVAGEPGINKINVKFDSETILLNSENELYVPIDFKTLIIDSEKIRTRVGGWLEEVPLISGTLATIDSEHETESHTTSLVTLSWPIDTTALSGFGTKFYADFAGTLYNGASYNKTLIFIDDVALDDNITTWTLDRTAGTITTTYHQGYSISGHPSLSVVVTNNGEKVHFIDNKYVNIDNTTIFLNEDGEISSLTPQSGIATEVANYRQLGTSKVNVLYDDQTLAVDSENKLKVSIDKETLIYDADKHAIKVPIDSETIQINSEGKLAAAQMKAGKAIELVATSELGVKRVNVKYDDTSIKRTSETNELYVSIDNKTIINDGLELTVPIDNETIAVNSEGKLHSLIAKLNGVELKGDKNTEEVKVTWWGTKDEYEALEAAGELYPYTLYVVDCSEGYIPSTPNYESLSNKPSINSVELSGNKSLSELDIQKTLSGGTAISIDNNVVNLKYHAGVLTTNTSNELFANTYTTDQINNLVGSMRTIKVVSVKPESPAANTLYYVESGTPNLYNVYLYDSDKNEISLGTSQVGTYTAGTSINIDVNNIVSVKRDSTITSTATEVPTTQAVYNFVMTGATTSTNGVRGLVPDSTNTDSTNDPYRLLDSRGQWVKTFGGATAYVYGHCGAVPQPGRGQQNYLLRGDATWAELVDNCVTDDSTIPLSAKQGKYLEDRLGTDIAWTRMSTNDYIASGNVYYKKKNNIVEINVDALRAISPVNVEIGTLPVTIHPDKLIAGTVIALNNSNATAGFTIDTAGTVKFYSSTGQYPYYGTITYTM